MEEETKASIGVMEGMYVSPDINLQLVTIQDFNDYVPVEWQVFGITHTEDDPCEWSCVVKKKGEAFFDDNGNEVKLTSDSIEWADGTVWKKLGVSSAQMYIMTRRRRVMYTPLLLYMCFVMYEFVKSNVIYMKDKAFAASKMSSKVM